MKIYLPTENPTTGKGFFCARLAQQFQALGHTIAHSLDIKHDITLHVIKYEGSRGAKHVLRLDGVYHDSRTSRNKEIGLSLLKADGVVYQGNFCQKMAERFLKAKAKKDVVIPNGICLKTYDNIEPMEAKYAYNFLTSARWRPQKRLRDTIESFLLASIPDSVLYVAGSTKASDVSKVDVRRYAKNTNIIFLGKIEWAQLARYIKIINTSIHLSWIDWCPNSVVEAIGAGKVVVTNNVGGTQELVSPSNGIVCDIDARYDMKECNLQSPPAIDRNIVAQALLSSIRGPRNIQRDHVDIELIARRYIHFFEGLLNE
jgi:glycosyltransferase involved in cell wall biosynthesis